MNRFIQTLTMASLLAAAAAPLVAQSRPAARPPGSASQRAAASLDASADEGWPRAYVSPSGASIVLYQPQIASWPDQEHMTLYVAVSYLAKDKQTPAIGALKVESDTSVALEDRLVGFSDFTITEASFPLSRDTATYLNQDRSARMDGAQRTRDFNSAGRLGSGSYRPSGGFGGGGGGGFRGGGGGFRGGKRR